MAAQSNSKQDSTASVASIVSSNLAPHLTPNERLSLSRAELVNLMKKNNHVLQGFEPVVQRYIASNPVKTLGIAVAVGAAVIVLKPWRFLTLRNLLVVLKSQLKVK